MGNILANKGFRAFGILTVVAVYFLILVGGIVRSTGSGMGCPDWPKCFGHIIPPTSVEDLPDNYKEIFATKRFEKNRRVASVFSTLGFTTLAEKLVNDKSIYEEVDFDPITTWIEYINRLVGVTIGLLIIGFVGFSFKFRKTDISVFYLSICSLALVIFQGWLGSLVVSTNLMPFMISIHMVLAILLVIMLIYTVYRGGAYRQLNSQIKSSGLLKGTIIVLMVLTFIQIMIGVQVREEVDILMTIGVERNSIISNLRDSFLLHRSFSILLVIGHVFILYKIYKKYHASFNLKFWCNFIFLLVVLSSVTGIVLNYFSFPAFIQPVHLLLASMLIGGQFIICLLVHTTNKVVKTV